MQRLFARLILVSAFVAVGAPQPSHAVFGKLFKRSKNEVPNVEQSGRVENEAARQFAEAEAAGNEEKASDLYKKLVKNYPHSSYAPEAQFRHAAYLDRSGNLEKAFQAYQTLVTQYRGSPRFQEAIDRQFAIASAGRTAKSEKFLWVVPIAMSDSRVITMYGQIIENAPRSAYAPESQFAIGELEEKNKRFQEAITAYQKVVDDYPQSAKAPEAQLRIGRILEQTIERGNRNPVDLAKTREAYEDFITNFPEHESAEDALMNIEVLSAQEARKNLQVGGFYQRQGNPKAAAIYYSAVARNSDDPGLQAEAQRRLDTIAARNPEAMELAAGSSVERTPIDRLLKARPDYVGPPSPDVAEAARNPRPGDDLLNSAADQVPMLPIEEPNLPEGSGEGVNIEPIIPSEPPQPGDELGLPEGVDPFTDPEDGVTLEPEAEPEPSPEPEAAPEVPEPPQPEAEEGSGEEEDAGSGAEPEPEESGEEGGEEPDSGA